MKQKLFLIFILICNLGISQKSSNLPEGFDYVQNIIPSMQVELRYFGTHNFIGQSINGYNRHIAILSNQAIIALKNVQEELLKYNLSVKMFDGYRPQRAVNHFVRWAKVLNDTVGKQEFYPNVMKHHLFKEGYIAARSGHSRGSTLDMTLVDSNTGKELDMGSPWDFFGKESWVENNNLTAQQRANRMLLQTIMLKHGFKHYPKEWWHFTLKNEPFPETYFDFVVE